MVLLRFLILYLALVFALTKANATHIVGGEIYYTKLNANGDYEVTMKHYRDCYNGNPQALDGDLLSYVFVYNSDDGSLVSIVSVNALSNQNLNAPLINPCLIAPGNVCVDEAIFKFNINLPPNQFGYDLVYQRCCRNGTIVNIQNPGAVGSTIFAHVPGTLVVNDNSSPRYKNFPPIFICTNDPLSFDNSATDPDGDIIRYELCDAFLGASSNCPKPGGGNCANDEPGPPPYPVVPYASGFSGANPITGFPNFQIDSITGLLTGTATQTGQYVLTVCAKEYRNGVLISINRREFQFNVVNCGFPIAAFPTQVDKCTGMDFTFSQTSFNATNFWWDFGDGSTSTGGTVNHTYTDTGVYTVTLVATNNNPGCADTVQKLVYAYPKLLPTFIAPAPQCLDENSFSFAASGIYDPAATFSWNFGANANPVTSALEQPNGVRFTTDGVKTINLTVSQFSCSKTVTQNVTIYPEPRPQIIPGPAQCTGDTVFIKIQHGGNNINSTVVNPGNPDANYVPLGGGNYQLIYQDTGLYDVTVISSNTFGCKDTVVETIKVYPKFAPKFVAPFEQCLQGNSFTFNASGQFNPSQATFSWYFDNTANVPSAVGPFISGITFQTDGYHTVVLEGYQYACIGRDTQRVYVIPEPVAQIKVQDQFCEGLTYNFTNESQVATSYFWDFGVPNLSSDISTQQHPTYQFPDTGTYNVMLVAINESICFDTTYRAISIKPLVKPFFPPPGGQCLDNNKFSFSASGYSGNTATFTWTISEEANVYISNQQTVSNVIFNQSGAYPIILEIQEFGCKKDYVDTAFVYPPPNAAFKIPHAKGCVPVTVNFRDSSSSTTSYTYLWNFGDGNSSTQANPTHTYTQPGNYSVSLIIQNTNGCTRRDTFRLTNAVLVYALPQANLVLDSLQRSIFEPFISFTDVSVGADKCNLILSDGSAYNFCTVKHTFPDTGWYEYIQIVENANGCRDTLKGKIYIRPDFVFYIPNAFTPNNDLINPVFKPEIFGVREYDFRVYDRWGLELFQTNETQQGWDGKYKGKPAPVDVYVYRVKYLNVFNKEKIITGTFCLVR